MPDSVASIGNYAFSGCKALTELNLTAAITNIGNYAFSGCSNVAFDKLSLPNLTVYNSSVFVGCHGLTGVEFCKGLTSIGSYAFQNCSSLSNVWFKGGVPTVGSSPFAGVAKGARGYYSSSHRAEWKAVIGADGKWQGLLMRDPYRVENVRARQVPGTQKVKVLYDLVVEEGEKYDVGLKIGGHGSGGGVPAATIRGDFGVNVRPGRNKEMEWDAGTDVTDAVLTNLVAEVEATREGETLEGESGEFGVDTRGPEFEIQLVESEYCSGRRGSAYGRHGTFLSGVECEVEFHVWTGAETPADRVRVNGKWWAATKTVEEGAYAGSSVFTFDVGQLLEGEKMLVVAFRKEADGTERESGEYAVNLDIASVPEGAPGMEIVSRENGRILYGGTDWSMVRFYKDVDDGVDLAGISIPWKVMPVLKVAQSMDSATGRYSEGMEGGAWQKMSKKWAWLRKPQTLMCTKGVDAELGLEGTLSLEWLPEARKWGRPVGSISVKAGIDVGISSRLPQTLWLVKLEGGIQVAAAFVLTRDAEGEYSAEIKIDPMFGVYGAVTAGVPYVSATGKAGGGIVMSGCIAGKPGLTKVSLGGKLWAEAQWRVFKWGNWKTPWQWSTNYNFGSWEGENGRRAESGGQADGSAMPRMVLSAEGDAGDVMASPSLAVGGEHVVVAGGKANGARGVLDAPEVVAGASWDAAVGVWDDGTADAMPSAGAWADGGAVVAWMNAKRTFGEEEGLGDVCAAMEIAVAVRDAGTGAWSATNLTDDAAADEHPRVAAAGDGTAMVAWVRNPGGGLFGTAEAPSEVWAARYAEGAWSAPVAVARGCGAVAGLDLAYDGERGAVAWTCDGDGDFATEGDWMVGAAEWSGGTWAAAAEMASGLAEAGAVVACLWADGTAWAVWEESGALKERRADGSGVAVAAKMAWDGEVPGDARAARGANGELALVWTSGFGDDGVSLGVVAMPRDAASGVWGGPVTVAGESGRQASGVSGAFGVDGGLRVAYESAVVADDGEGGVEVGAAEVRFAEVSGTADPAVLAEDFAFGVALPLPGEVVPARVVARNLGLGAVTGATVRVWVSDGDGEATELFGDGGEVASLDLPGGAAVVLTNYWTCDDSLGELRFTARVEVPEGAGNAVVGNDEAVWRPGTADLWLEDARAVAESATVRALRATVRNYGLAGAGAGAVVVFRRGASDGEEIGRDEVGAVLAGEANGYDAGVVWDMAGGTWTGAWETVYAVFGGMETEEAAARAAVLRVMTPLDTDGDGLLDAEEEMFGTDPEKADTDGDGRSDYEEVYVDFTDPVVAPVPDHTTGTPVPVPHAWLEGYPEALAAHGGDYEAFAADVAENGQNRVWECYVAGISPTDKNVTFKAVISFQDGKALVKGAPDWSGDGKRVYRVDAKKAMSDEEEWTDVTGQEETWVEDGWRFFKVGVKVEE